MQRSKVRCEYCRALWYLLLGLLTFGTHWESKFYCCCVVSVVVVWLVGCEVMVAMLIM